MLPCVGQGECSSGSAVLTFHRACCVVVPPSHVSAGSLTGTPLGASLAPGQTLCRPSELASKLVSSLSLGALSPRRRTRLGEGLSSRRMHARHAASACSAAAFPRAGGRARWACARSACRVITQHPLRAAAPRSELPGRSRRRPAERTPSGGVRPHRRVRGWLGDTDRSYPCLPCIPELGAVVAEPHASSRRRAQYRDARRWRDCC